MNSNRKGRRLKLLTRAFAAGATCFAGILLGIWLSRIDLVNYAANWILQEKGYIGSSIQLARLDLSGSTLQNARLQIDGLTIEIQDAEIAYESDTLWNEKKLKSIHVSHLYLWYDSAGSSSESPPIDLSELEAQIKRVLPLPFETLEIEDASIQAIAEQGSFAGKASLKLSQNTPSVLQARLAVQTENAALTVDATFDEALSYTADVSTKNVHEALVRHGLDLKNLLGLPENASLEPSWAKARVTGLLSEASWDEAAIELDLGPIRYNASDATAEARSLKAELTLDSEGKASDLKVSLDLKSAAFGPIAIEEAPIEIAAPTPLDVSLTLPETRWRSESGEQGSLAATIRLQRDDENAPPHFTIQGTASELVSDAFAVLPFSFSIEGDPQSLSLATSPLVLQQYPWLRLENLRLAVAEADTDNPLLDVAAILVATSNDSTSSPIAGNWELTATLRPQASPQSVALSLKPIGPSRISISSKARIEGQSALQLSLERWPENDRLAFDATLSASNASGSVERWTIDGGAAEATLASDSLPLSELQAAWDQPVELLERIARSCQYGLAFQGNQLSGPDNSSAQWFSGTLKSRPLERNSPDPIQADLELGIGIARAAAEEFQQVFLKASATGTARRLKLDSQSDLLFEGEPVSLVASQALDLASETPSATGPFAIKGIHLVSSDILYRQNPALSGTTVSARVDIEGNAGFEEGEWDAAATLRLQEGAFAYPTEDLALEGIETTLSFASLAALRSQPSQSISAARMTLGDLEATDLSLQFTLNGLQNLSIEHAQLATFDGVLSLDPATLSLERPDAELIVRFKQISIAPVIAMLDFFDGQVNGRLNGFLPISLKNGRPVLGEGSLELDRGSDATFSYNAHGAFTASEEEGVIPQSFGDKLLKRLGLEPNALLEEALGNLKILDLKVDLFSQDLVGTPMRVQLSGIADTGEVQIPLHLTTNVNGTVADLVDFFLRLDSLGLVVEKSGFSK